MRIAVVGGGVIGLASARALARAGCAVTLLDAAPEAREASWAAAGMLAPHHECSDGGALWRLGTASLAAWPEFAQELGSERLDLHFTGGVIPECDDHDRAANDRRAALLAGLGVACERLDGAALARREPALRARGALLAPGGHVDPRALVAALRDDCLAQGVAVRYRATVTAIAAGGVTTNDGQTLACDHVVLASGAWTPALAALAGIDLIGEPVKGQLLRFSMQTAAPTVALAGFVHSERAYLVPRRDHSIVVGATMASVGFDRSQDEAAILALATRARALVPALADAPIVETWTGLRPRLRDALPLIARARPWLTIATGHFRNGILLTPISAAAVAALVLERPLPCDLSPFTLRQSLACPISSSPKTTP